MLELKNYIQNLFPKVCLACEKALDVQESENFLCRACRSEIRLKLESRCLVCSLDQSGCLLCKNYSSKPKPNWIQVALESTPSADRMMRSAYRPFGWIAHRSIANLLYARFLWSCEPKPTHWVALPDPGKYFGASSYHLDLAKELAKTQQACVMSWNRARFYKAKPSDRLVLVGFQSNLETLMNHASNPTWIESGSIGVLIGLLQ